MKILFLILVLGLISCGKPLPQGGADGYTGKTVSWKGENIPVKFHVNREYYNKYRSHFEEAQDTMVSKSGKQLIEYVISTDNPKTIVDLETRRAEKGENWIVGKESLDEFPGWEGARGVTYSWYGSENSLKNVRIIFNHPNLSGSKRQYRAFFLHEMMHGMGFGHYHEGASILSYDWLYADTQEITAVDRELLSRRYSFSLDSDYIKDLEFIGSQIEAMEVAEMEDTLINYGLSNERAQKLGKLMNSYSKIKTKRALTSREKDVFTKELTGLSFKKASSLLVEEGYDALVEKASEVNEADPEAIKELLSEIL